VTVQSYIKKVEDGVQAPFKKTATMDAETQTPFKRRCVWPRNARPDS
jgi:hypothetical protein